MIYQAIDYLVKELNRHIELRFELGDRDHVVAGNLLTAEGNQNPATKEKIAAVVAGITEDRISRSTEVYRQRDDGATERVEPNLRMRLNLVFVATHDSYDEGLVKLGHVMTFFQHRRTFPCNAIPDYADGQGFIAMKLRNLDFENQNHLWAALGPKYMPSVLYELGIIELIDDRPLGEAAPVRDIITNAVTGGGAS